MEQQNTAMQNEQMSGQEPAHAKPIGEEFQCLQSGVHAEAVRDAF